MSGPTVTLVEAARRSQLSLAIIPTIGEGRQAPRSRTHHEGMVDSVASLVEAGAWGSTADTSPGLSDPARSLTRYDH